ncbi:MAG: uncharacterized protein JWO22_4142 [Frankiales bacterium]|nr:uncharacterized protein [Frankiales bacterium]
MLTELLAAEHAAVYGYGVLGAHLDDRRRVAALSAYDAHRVLRDSLLARLSARSLPTPAPALAYASPAGTPAQQAIALEDGLCVLWRDLVASTDSTDLRGLAVRALSDAAVRAVRWRQSTRQHPVTVPLPGTAG